MSKYGACDFSTIQAAIEAAHSAAPSAEKPYQVLVKPGYYEENLIFYDYVNVSGYMNPRGVVLQYEAANAVLTIANSRLENLVIEDLVPYTQRETVIDAAVNANVAAIYDPLDPGVLLKAAPTFTIRNVAFSRPDTAGQQFLYLLNGTVRMEDCWVRGGRYDAPLLQLAGGKLEIWRSLVQLVSEMNTTARGALSVAGNADIDAHYSRFEAISTFSNYALHMTGTGPNLCRFLHCSLRSSNGAAAIANATGTSQTCTFGHDLVNVARTGSFSGLSDFITDTGV